MSTSTVALFGIRTSVSIYTGAIWDKDKSSVNIYSGTVWDKDKSSITVSDKDKNSINIYSGTVWDKVKLKPLTPQMSSHLCVDVCRIEFHFLGLRWCRGCCNPKALHPFLLLLILVNLTQCLSIQVSQKNKKHIQSCTEFLV